MIMVVLYLCENYPWMIMIELSVDELWEVIYASRDSEKYWRSRRRFGDDIYSQEELELKFQDAKERTRWLESLAPKDSF